MINVMIQINGSNMWTNRIKTQDKQQRMKKKGTQIIATTQNIGCRSNKQMVKKTQRIQTTTAIYLQPVPPFHNQSCTNHQIPKGSIHPLAAYCLPTPTAW